VIAYLAFATHDETDEWFWPMPNVLGVLRSGRPERR